MQGQEFDSLVDEVAAWFNVRPPSRESRAAWFKRLGNVPTEAVEWIGQSMTTRFDKFPANFPNTFWQLWQEWLRDHPDRRSFEDRLCRLAACDNGLLHLRKDTDQGYSAVYAYRCVDCRRSELSGIPEIRLADALRGGFTVDKDIVPVPVRDEYKPGNGRGVDLEQAMKELEELRKRREPMLGIDDDELPF